MADRLHKCGVVFDLMTEGQKFDRCCLEEKSERWMHDKTVQYMGDILCLELTSIVMDPSGINPALSQEDVPEHNNRGDRGHRSDFF